MTHVSLTTYLPLTYHLLTSTYPLDKAKMDSEYMSLMAELGVAEEGAGLSSSNAPPSMPSG